MNGPGGLKYRPTLPISISARSGNSGPRKFDMNISQSRTFSALPNSAAT